MKEKQMSSAWRLPLRKSVSALIEESLNHVIMLMQTVPLVISTNMIWLF